MAIGDQFSGLDMTNLIGSPLRATADASLQLAESTAEFINKVGFDGNGNLRTASFQYQKKTFNDDGSANSDEMKVDVPMLAIVPIPNLQVDEVNILFDMEVKQSERSESSTDLGATITGSANFGIFKVSVSGSVSSHSSNTRSSDNSAKYHVDVRATNHGIPEGLARVLDMMSSSLAPSTVGSTPVDENGKPITDDTKKEKITKLKELRSKKMLMENAVSAARNTRDNKLALVKKAAANMQNQIILSINNKLNDSQITDEQKESLNNALTQINTSWNSFQQNISSVVETTAASGSAKQNKLLTDNRLGDDPEPPSKSLYTIITLKTIDNDYKVINMSSDGEIPLDQPFQNTVMAQTKMDSCITEAGEIDAEYNALLIT